MIPDLYEWLQYIVRRIGSYMLFGVAGYHAIRAGAAYVCGNPTGAKEHGAVSLVFGVAALAINPELPL